ncbi:MAG: DUF1843 domain-containing protein [Rhizomicrobium sp.]
MVKPYGPAIQQAVASGNLKTMKSLATAAEKHLEAHGDVSAALQMLKAEIAKLEHKA